MDDRELHEIASRRAAAKLSVFIHAAVYLVVVCVLGVINALTSHYPWFLFPALGWGIGLVIHTLVVFTFSGLHERLVRTEVERLQRERAGSGS